RQSGVQHVGERLLVSVAVEAGELLERIELAMAGVALHGVRTAHDGELVSRRGLRRDRRRATLASGDGQQQKRGEPRTSAGDHDFSTRWSLLHTAMGGIRSAR